MTPEEMNQITRTARTLANEILDSKLAPRSEAAYAAIIKRCYVRDAEGNIEGFEYPPEPTRKRTYYQYRAAFRRYLGGQIKAILARADSCQRSGNQGMREAELAGLQEILEMLGPEGRFGKKFIANQDTERTENRSKRRTLRYFQKNWEEKVFEAAGPIWQPAIAALAIAGCRPGELEKGVCVTKDMDKVTLRIAGLKTNSGHGQPQRTITVYRTDLTAKYIDALPEGEVKVKSGSLRTTLNRISHRLWPKKKEKISAYSFRHRTASNAKAAGVDPVEIAAILGHSVTKTQSMYGATAQGSRSRGEGVTATASREIRDNRRLPPGLREDLAETASARPE
ncbi:MAG: site-specific integrase [Leptospirales bacterium]